MAYYKSDQAREIPIPDVLQDYGIKLDRNGKFSLRAERTPSVKYYPETNSWFDFGDSSGGGVIDLVSRIDGVPFVDALQTLGSRYGLEEINAPKTDDKQKNLTDRQYAFIGLQGDRAGKNYSFDFETYTEEQNMRLSKKLAIPMNELFEKYPKTYVDIVRKHALPTVHEEQQNYLKSLFHLSQAVHPNDIEFIGAFAREYYDNYQKTFNILERATKGTDIKTHRLKADFDKDLEAIKQGRLLVEIGEYSYRDFKSLIGKALYAQMPYKEYLAFERHMSSQEDPMPCPYSAFVKGDLATIVYKELDKDFFTVELEKSKQQILPKNMERMTSKQEQKDLEM